MNRPAVTVTEASGSEVSTPIDQPRPAPGPARSWST